MRVNSQPAGLHDDRPRGQRPRELAEASNLTQTKKKSKDYKSHLIGKLKMHGKLSKFLESAEEVSFFHNPKDVAYLISLVEHEDYENLSASLIHALLVLLEKQKACICNSTKRQNPAAGTDNTKRTLISFLNEQESPGSSLERRQHFQASGAAGSLSLSKTGTLEADKRTEEFKMTTTGGQLNSKGMLIQDQAASDKLGVHLERNPYQLLGNGPQPRKASPAGLPSGKPSDSSNSGTNLRNAAPKTGLTSSNAQQGVSEELGNQATFRSGKQPSQHTQRQTEGDLYNYSEDEQPEPKTEKKWATVNLQWNDSVGRQAAGTGGDLELLRQLKTETSNEEERLGGWTGEEEGGTEGVWGTEEDGKVHYSDDGEAQVEFSNSKEAAEEEKQVQEGGSRKIKPNLLLATPGDEEYRMESKSGAVRSTGAVKGRAKQAVRTSPDSSDKVMNARRSDCTSEQNQHEDMAGDKSPAFGSTRNMNKATEFEPKLSPTNPYDLRTSPTGGRQPNPRLGGSPQLSFGGDAHRRDPKGTNNTTPSSQASGVRKDTAFYPGGKRFSKDSGSVDSTKLKGQKVEKDTFTFNDISSGPEVVKKGRNVSLDQNTLAGVAGLKKLESPSSDDNSKNKSKHASQASDDIQTNEIQGVFQIEDEPSERNPSRGGNKQPNPVTSKADSRTKLSSTRLSATSPPAIQPKKRSPDPAAIVKIPSWKQPLSSQNVTGKPKGSSLTEQSTTLNPILALPSPPLVTPSNKTEPSAKPAMSLSPETKPKVKLSILSKSGSADKPTGINAGRLSTNHTENSEQVRFSRDLVKKGLTSSFEASSGFKRSELLSHAKKVEEPSLSSQSHSRLPAFNSNTKPGKTEKSQITVTLQTPLSTERKVTDSKREIAGANTSKTHKMPAESQKEAKTMPSPSTTGGFKERPASKAKVVAQSDTEASGQLHSNSVSNLLKDAKLSTKAPSSTDMLRDIRKSAAAVTHKPTDFKKSSGQSSQTTDLDRSGPKFNKGHASTKSKDQTAIATLEKSLTKPERPDSSSIDRGTPALHSAAAVFSKDKKGAKSFSKTSQPKASESVGKHPTANDNLKGYKKASQPMLTELKDPMNSNFFTGLMSPSDVNMSKSKGGELGLNDMSKIPNTKNESFEKDEDLSGLHRILKESWADPQNQNRAPDASLDFNNSRDFKGKIGKSSKDNRSNTFNTTANLKIQFGQLANKASKPAVGPSESRKTYTSNPGQHSQEGIGVSGATASSRRTDRGKFEANPEPRRISDIFNKASSKPSQRAGISSSFSAVRNSTKNLSQKSQASSNWNSASKPGSPQGLAKIVEKNKSASQSGKPLTSVESQDEFNSAKIESVKNKSKVPSKQKDPLPRRSPQPSDAFKPKDKISFTSQIPKVLKASSVQYSPRPASISASLASRKGSETKLFRPSSNLPKFDSGLPQRSSSLSYVRKSGSGLNKSSQPKPISRLQPSLTQSKDPVVVQENLVIQKLVLPARPRSNLGIIRSAGSQRKDSLLTKSSRYSSISRIDAKPVSVSLRKPSSKLIPPTKPLFAKNQKNSQNRLSSSPTPLPRVSSVPLIPKPAIKENKSSPRTILNQTNKKATSASKPQTSIREVLSSRQSSNSISRYSASRNLISSKNQKPTPTTFNRKQGSAALGLAPSPLPTIPNQPALSQASSKPSTRSAGLPKRVNTKSIIEKRSGTLFSSQNKKDSVLNRPKSSLLFGRSISRPLEGIQEDVVSHSSRAASFEPVMQVKPSGSFQNKPLYPTGNSKGSGSVKKGAKIMSTSQLLKDLRKSGTSSLASPPPTLKQEVTNKQVAEVSIEKSQKQDVQVQKLGYFLPQKNALKSKSSLDVSRKATLATKQPQVTASIIVNESRSASVSDISKNHNRGHQSDRIVIDTVKDMLFKSNKNPKTSTVKPSQPSVTSVSALKKAIRDGPRGGDSTSAAQVLKRTAEPKQAAGSKKSELTNSGAQVKVLETQSSRGTRASPVSRVAARPVVSARSRQVSEPDQQGTSTNSRSKSKGYEVPNRILEEVYEDDESPKKMPAGSGSAIKMLKASRTSRSPIGFKPKQSYDPTSSILKSLDSGKKIGLSPILPIKGNQTSIPDGRLFDSQDGSSPQVDKFEPSRTALIADLVDKPEDDDKQNASYGEYSAMLHKLKAFSHRGGLQPYHQAQTSRDASIEIIKAMDSLANKSLVPQDMSTEERLFRVPKEKPTPDKRFDHLRGGRINGLEESLSGAKTPIISARKPDPNLSKSFGSGRKDHRFSLEDYSMMTEMCKSPDDPIEITAHFTGSIGGRTQPWSRRHFPDRDQSRSSQNKLA